MGLATIGPIAERSSIMQNILYYIAQAPGFELGVRDLVLDSGPMAKLVLLLLFGMSIFTWAIIGAKWIIVRRAMVQTRQFLESFRQHGSPAKIIGRVRGLRGTPLLRLLLDSYRELQSLHLRQPTDSPNASSQGAMLKASHLKFIGSSMDRAISEETERLEIALPFLATTGSTAPFIGLFGTVWGVMRAFQGIGAANSTSIATVAPGISEALVATAAGLVAAIPAVVGYNFFLNRIRRIQKSMESFSSELLDYLEKRYGGG